jgi:hypothetical protein
VEVVGGHRKERRTDKGLSGSSYEDPSSLSEAVTDLLNLGFSDSQSRSALRLSNGNSDLAYELLLSSEVNPKGPSAATTTATSTTAPTSASSPTVDTNNKGVVKQLQPISNSDPIFRELSLSASICDQRPKHMVEKSPPVEGYTRACAYQQGSCAYLFGQVATVATDMMQRTCIHTSIHACYHMVILLSMDS